jgi:hypothetical protein
MLGTVIALAVVVGLVGSALEGMATRPGGSLRTAAAVTATSEANVAARPLDDLIDPGDRLLSADPGIPVAYGQLPVVLNPFLLPRLGRDHPEWIDALVERIDRAEFDVVILLIEVGTPFAEDWYATYDFGSEVATAIEDRYRLLRQDGRFYVYVPA